MAHGGIIDLENIDRLFAARPKFIDADHSLSAGVDARLRARGGFLDAQLRQPRIDRARHAAELFDFANVAPGPRREMSGEPLDEKCAVPWIDDTRRAAFLLQHDLGIARDTGRKVSRQRQRLIQRVGVQRLRAALRCRHCLNAGAHDVVEHVLRRERPARRLAMSAQ